MAPTVGPLSYVSPLAQTSNYATASRKLARRS